MSQGRLIRRPNRRHSADRALVSAEAIFWLVLVLAIGFGGMRAVAGLPLDSTTRASEISRRRATARDSLLAAKATLWTTDATGFAGDHKLPRTLRVVELR